eukprot:NODE_277_length_2771_cov_40.227719_g261_i0.p1 GENE.NODE_277_length_2771_cov_40.227719_g261_i0~~NODE_277_length_2771_cov_40.227719_g261_i0.p1  ORF type:complete len:897 (-),score=249.83 NODE_277_length_2771_cov_40.227719_g261_i0:81-2717(-)
MTAGGDAKRAAKRKLQGSKPKGPKSKAKGSGKKGKSPRTPFTKKEVSDFVFENPRNKRGLVAMEKRRTGELGVEFANRNRHNIFVDRRPGRGKNLTEDDKMWAKLIKQRQLMAKQKDSMYDLHDEEDSLGDQTSLGRVDQPERTLDEMVPERKKTKQEVMQEIIGKSKVYKEEARQEQAERAKETDKLDDQFASIEHLLKFRTPVRRKGGVVIQPEGKDADAEVAEAEDAMDEDQGEETAASKKSKKAKKGEEPRESEEKEDKPKKEKKGVKFALPEDHDPKKERGNKPPTEWSDDEDEEEDAEDVDVSGIDVATASYEDLEKLFKASAKGGKAGDRTATEEELLSAAKETAQRMKAEKEARMRGEKVPVEEAEAEPTPQDNLDDESLLQQKGSKAAPTDEVSGVLQSLLVEFEAHCKAPVVDFAQLDELTLLVVQLTRVDARSSVKALSVIMQDLYERWQLACLKSKTKEGSSDKLNSPPVTGDDVFGCLFAKLLTVCFPASDWRHAICTPLLLWLVATLEQYPVTSERHLALGLFRCTMVLEMITETKRFVPEALNFLCNALTLTCTTEGVTAAQSSGFVRTNSLLPIVLPETPVAPGLLQVPATFTPTANGKDASDADADARSRECRDSIIPRLNFHTLLSGENNKLSTPLVRLQLAKAIYQLLECYHDLFRGHGAYAEAFQPVVQTLQNVHSAGGLHPSLQRRHAALTTTLSTGVDRCRRQRKPLAWQVLRPVPLKLYECDIEEPKAYNEKKEVTPDELKKKHRKAQREAVRAIRWDNRYLEEARGKEQADEDERRQKKYNQVVAELGEQQHMIGQAEAAWMKHKTAHDRKKSKERRKSAATGTGGSSGKDSKAKGKGNAKKTKHKSLKLPGLD